jgi:hypothetical protein
MKTLLSVLRMSLAVIGGWFVIVLWFLLLTVGKSPLNQIMESIGIIPLMTHSNVGGVLDVSHWSFMIQSVLVFSTGGLLTAFIAKDHELIASLILGVFVVLTCIIWDSNINCRVYYAVDLFIWFFGFSLIMLSGFITNRKRLIDYILLRITKGSLQPRQNTTGRPPVHTSGKQKKH